MKAAKAWYFAYFAALSCIFPFLNLFFRRLGLGERVIGVLGAARPLISLPAGSLFSGLADKTRRHRVVLLACFAASVAARLAIAPVGAHWGAGGTVGDDGDSGSVHSSDSSSAAFVPLLLMVLLTEFFAAPVTIIVDSAVMAACREQGDYGKQRLFGALGWGLFSAVAGTVISHAGIYAAFACHAALVALALPPTLRLPFGPLHAKLDQQTGGVDGNGSNSEEDGARTGDDGSPSLKWEQRGQGLKLASRGSTGYGEQAAEAEAEAEAGGLHGVRRGVERFDSALEAQSLLAGSHHHNNKAGSSRGSGSRGSHGEKARPPPALFASCPDITDGNDSSRAQQQPQPQPQPQPQQQQQQRVRYWAGVAQLLRSPDAAIFMAMAVFMGVGVGNIEGYLFLFLDELGGSELLMGLSLTVTCAAESVVFYFLPQLLRLGIRRCMHLVFLAFLVRMGCYWALPYAPTPWLVLPVEVLHGLTFALAWGGGCAYAQQLAPPGLEATTQGLFQGLYFGLGVAAGSALGGQVYQQHGAQAVYLVACGVLAAGWLLCSLAQAAVHLLGRQPAGSGKYLQVPAAVQMSEHHGVEEASIDINAL